MKNRSCKGHKIKRMKKKSFMISLVIVSVFCVFLRCKNQQEMKIANINTTTGTFDFIDVKSGSKISYGKLMLNEQEVVDFHCSDISGGSVVFAVNKSEIVRSGNSITMNGGKGFTIHAILKYKLEDGVLTILYPEEVKDNTAKEMSLGQDTKAKAFLEKLTNATSVENEDNGIGLYIKSVIKSDEDYIVDYGCANQVVWENNRVFLMTQIYFIDPENYENKYQPFTIDENGNIKAQFKDGDEIAFPVRRIQFEPPSKVMYMYFVGIDNDQESRTVPLFFTIVLGDHPYVLEDTPRYANGLFQ